MVGRDPLADPEPLIQRVYMYVATRIGEGPEAEDVTSDVFERALRYRDSYDRSKGEPITWLIGIARRSISAAGARREALDLFTAEPASEDMEEQAIRRLALRGVLASLNERERELIALRYGADLTARQIAELLDERQNTIEVALHRLLARLRAELERESAAEAAP